MAKRITEKLVRKLAPPDKGSRINYDDQIKGFGVRVTANSAKAFILNYRIHGCERRYTIGGYPGWSVAAARDEAKVLRRRIDRGDDPLQQRIDARAAPTVADLCERYSNEHLPEKRPSSQRDDRAMIDQIIRPKLGRLKVANVEIDDVKRLHRSLSATPYRANRVLALISKMFNLAESDWKLRPQHTNPCRGVKRFTEIKRKRYLSQAEIVRLTEALASYPNQTAANCVRFLLLTGCRRGEALAATWGEFDLERGTWTKPSAHTKTKEEHHVPLSAPALKLLADIKADATSDYVFASRNGQPFADLKKAWGAIRKAAAIDDVRLHDLRHSYASILASAGLSLPVIGQLLGHTQPATTQRYAHLFDDPLREATERVAAFVESAGNAPADVVRLRKGR